MSFKANVHVHVPSCDAGLSALRPLCSNCRTLYRDEARSEAREVLHKRSICCLMLDLSDFMLDYRFFSTSLLLHATNILPEVASSLSTLSDAALSVVKSKFIACCH